MKIYMARHGQTQWNADNKICGRTDLPLTETGLAQAQKLADNTQGKDIEIIVVNDGSPDNSQAIIDEYVEKYPKLVQSFIKENGGQGSARNLGIEKAKGEFLSFIDSDDWIDKNMLEEMYNLAQKEKTDIVICDMTDHFSTHEIRHNCTKFDSVYGIRLL